MIKKIPSTHIVYRCPKCGEATYGLVGKFALSCDMLRLKCECGESMLDISVTNDKKIRLSVPCLYCGQNHNYVLSQSIFFERELFILSCPYANMDIAFIGDKERTDAELIRTGEEIEKLLINLEAESISDLQPQEVSDDEILPDPQVYDTIRFLIKDLEAEKKIDCPCHSGVYDIRFSPDGIQAYCDECGATYTFNIDSESRSQEYIDISELFLK